MYWSRVLCVIWLSTFETNGQRRAFVYYSLTSPEEVESVSENPLSSSINSIQTGREELTAYPRGDSGETYRRSYQKTTTPDYFKGSLAKTDSSNAGKSQYGHSTKAPEVVVTAPTVDRDDSVQGSETHKVSSEHRPGEGPPLKDKRSSGSETTSSPASVRHGNAPKLDEKGLQNKDEVKVSMDVVKDASGREQDRRSNTHENRRQTTTPASSGTGRYNTSVRDSTDRHREDLPDKTQVDRSNRERRPPAAAESGSRGHRTATRSASEKGQTLPHSSGSRNPVGQSYDRAEQPPVGAVTQDRKIPDRVQDGKGETDPQDKVYPAGNPMVTNVRDDRADSIVVNKPTHLLIGQETPAEASRNPDVYRDEFRGGSKVDGNEKIGSDAEKSSRSGGRTYNPERPYIGDDVEKSPGHQGRDSDREYTRRNRDRYDDRSYEDNPTRDRQTHRNRERNATQYPDARTVSRSSRPRDESYDKAYEDDRYPQSGVIKDTDSISKERTRATDRRIYGIDDDAEVKDKYPDDSTRTYRDYSDDRRYRDEIAVGTDGVRRYRDDNTRSYDDDEDKDRYSRRYESDDESRRYRDDGTRRYAGSGSRRYDDEETRRYGIEYDRPVRRYEDADEYTYNDTQAYRSSYGSYNDSNRRSSGGSGGSRRYDETGASRGRYDDEDYGGSRSYRTREDDRKYTRRDDEDTYRQSDTGRKYAVDDSAYREADADRRYETRVYSESSSKDRYDRDDRRTLDSTPVVGSRPSRDRLDTNSRDDYYDTRIRDSGVSQGSRSDESYRSTSYADDYYNNRSSPGYIERYGDSDRPSRRTEDNTSSFAVSDGDNRRYTSRYADERRRDRVYDVPSRRRQGDIDDTRGDRTRGYDDDRLSERSRGDTYDERSYRGRVDDEYIPSSRDRVRDYDARGYRDSDDEIDPRYRGRETSDTSVKYRGDDSTRDRDSDDELRRARPSGSRRREKGYADGRYEDDYKDRSSDGTYRYRDEDEGYRSVPSESRKPGYDEPETRNRGVPRSRDEYDEPYDRDYSSTRSGDERRREDRPSRRDDRYTDDRPDFDGKAIARPLPVIATSGRDDRKTEFSSPKGERSDRYDDDDRVRDGRLSPPRDSRPDGRIPVAPYASAPESIPPKSRTPEDPVGSRDKGDFSRGRRPSYYEEDGKTYPDREGGRRRIRDEKRFPRSGDKEEPAYSRDKSSLDSVYDEKELIQSDRSDLRPSTGSRTYSDRRESRVPVDLPPSDDTTYSDGIEGISRSSVSQSSDGSQRRRYSSASYDRGGRRRLPSVREPESERNTRRDDPDYKSVDPVLPESRGGYRYTNSRGDPDDFSRRPDEDPLAPSDGYLSRGTSSKAHDQAKRDMPKGEYGSPGTPTRSKEVKEEYYPSNSDRVPPPPRSSKPADEYDRRDKVPRSRPSVGNDDRGTYENGEYPHSSSPRDEEKFKTENSTRDRFESFNGEVRAAKESNPSSTVLSQTAPSGVRSQGSSISRSATPIPHYQGKEFVTRNTSSRNISDRYSGSSMNREKRFHYDDRSGGSNTSRTGTSVSDELSKRPLTTKEVIDAAYRHSEETEKQGEVIYPVYVPGSGNITSPEVIRPSERRGLTTPTKKKKKK